MRGRIFSWLRPSSSISPCLQSFCTFEIGAGISVRTLNSSTYQCTDSELPDSAASHFPRLDPNSCTLHGTLSSFQHIRCVESSVVLRTSSPSRSRVEAQSRSLVAIGNTVKGLNKSCWACKHEISSGNGLFCQSCDAIQPLDLSVDHFTLFGIERSFKVDSKVLEQRYKSLQKNLHPDLMNSKSQKEQGFSADQSAHVIQAYYTLLRPLSRARYLLALNGIRVDEEGTTDDPALLMEIMEIRESLEDVSDANELHKLRAQNLSRIQATAKALETTFAAGGIKNAVSWVQRLAYYVKVDEEIVRKL